MGTLRKNKSFLPQPLLVTKQSQVHFYECEQLVHSAANHLQIVCPFRTVGRVLNEEIVYSHMDLKPTLYIFLLWVDSKNVFMCSTLPDYTNQQETCMRRIFDKLKKVWSRKEITRPSLVRIYTSAMYGVDKGYIINSSLEIRRNFYIHAYIQHTHTHTHTHTPTRDVHVSHL